MVKHKTFKKGQYVKVMYRKYPYVGRYARWDTDAHYLGHIVNFAGQEVDCIKDKNIFAIQKLEKLT